MPSHKSHALTPRPGAQALGGEEFGGHCPGSGGASLGLWRRSSLAQWVTTSTLFLVPSKLLGSLDSVPLGLGVLQVREHPSLMHPYAACTVTHWTARKMPGRCQGGARPSSVLQCKQVGYSGTHVLHQRERRGPSPAVRLDRPGPRTGNKTQGEGSM